MHAITVIDHDYIILMHVNKFSLSINKHRKCQKENTNQVQIQTNRIT